MAWQWKTALITGGGSGIGLRLAEEFLGAGMQVALLDLKFSEDALARLAKVAGGALDGRCWTYEADVRQSGQMASAVRQATAQLGRLDLAINSAGVGYVGEFEKIAEEKFRWVIDINLMGSRNFAAAVLPHLQRGSQLVLVASLAGIAANYGYTAYNASKFGVVGLAGALRLECKPKGIDVSVVCPPEIETPMVEEERRHAPAATTKLKQFAGTLQVESAVRQILAGMRARRFMVIPGARARLTRRLAGIVPGLLQRISDGIVRKSLGS